MSTATRFLSVVRDRIVSRFQLTTDAFAPYIGAVEAAWGADAPDFAQLVKEFGSITPGRARYAPARFVASTKTIRLGKPRSEARRPATLNRRTSWFGWLAAV